MFILQGKRCILKRDGRGKLRIHNHDDARGFIIDGDTVVMIRGAMTYKDSYLV